MATIRKASSGKNKTRTRALLAVLLAAVLAAGPLLHYTPQALGGEVAGTATVNDAETAALSGEETTPPAGETEAAVVEPESTPEPVALPAASQSLAVQSLDAPLALSTASEFLFTINASGVITYFAYASSDPIRNLEIPATINGITVTGIGNEVFKGCQLESVVIPGTVTSLGTNAFYNNPLSGGVTFSGPSQLTTIGKAAFQNCTGMTSFDIPSTVHTISDSAFYSCVNMTSVVIPSGVTSLGNDAFQNCQKLSSVTLPESLTSLGTGSLKGCKALTSISLPSNLQSIGEMAFDRSGLTSLTVPASVQTIGPNAFTTMVNSTTFKLYLTNHYPDTITGKPWGCPTQYIYWKSDSNSCFYITPDGVLCGIKPAGHDSGACTNPTWHQNSKANIVIPQKVGDVTVTGLLPFVFSNNDNIKTVSFEAGCAITQIPESAFSGCRNLSSITVPPTLTSIGTSAFSGTNLTGITLPASVQNVGSKALNCGNLATVTFEGAGSLSIASDAFSAGEKIKDIYLTGRAYDSVAGQPWSGQYAAIHWANNKVYDPEVIVTGDGFHYNRITGLLVKYAGPTGPTVDVEVPKAITYNATTYTVAEPLPDGLFKSKTLNKITVAEGFTTLPAGFTDYATLNEVSLPSTITVIKTAFRYTTLKKITIPEGVTHLMGSFSDSTQLAEIENFLPAGIHELGGTAFRNVPLNIDNFKIPQGLKLIRNEVFANSGLTGEVTIPSSVQAIGIDAFNNNPGITAFYVDQFRASSPLKNTQPWTNNNNVNVYYKGEVPMPEAKEASDPALSSTPLTNVDFSASFEKDSKGNTAPGFMIQGVWVCKGDVEAFPADATRIYDAAADGARTEIADFGLALPNGIYTFWVSSNMMTKNAGTEADPSQYRRCTITIDKQLPFEVTAGNFNVKSSELPNIALEAALAKAHAEAQEPCYGADAALEISAADLAKINALSGNGSSTAVTVSGSFVGDYRYDGSLKNLFGSGGDGKAYAYSVADSTEVTATLSIVHTVTFEQGAHGTLDGSAGGRVAYEDLAIGSSMPAAPQANPDGGWAHIGWVDAAGMSHKVGELPATVDGDALYTAQWAPRADVPYVVEHYWQQPGSSYTLHETETMTATTGTEVTAQPKTYESYAENAAHPDRVVSGVVDGKNTTVLKLYYDAGSEPVVPAQNPGNPGGGSPIAVVVYPVAQALQGVASAITGQPVMPVEQTLVGDATPLAEGHGWCWVHFYIILLGLLTIAYALAVVARRRRFTRDLDQFEQSLVGRGDGHHPSDGIDYRLAGQGIGK